MSQRLTYRRRHAYNSPGNKQKIVKTPGGRLVYQNRTKVSAGVKCGDCHIVLPGIPHLRPTNYGRISKRQKTVNRAYGGSRCGRCVKERVLRAFLVEEQKLVKQLLRKSAAATAAAAAAAELAAKDQKTAAKKAEKKGSKKPDAKKADAPKKDAKKAGPAPVNSKKAAPRPSKK